jgi:hypothetical protein
MRKSLIWLLPMVLGPGCSGSELNGEIGADGGARDGAIIPPREGGLRDGAGSAQRDAAARDAAFTFVDAGVLGNAGNPTGSCSAGVPAKGRPADTSTPTTVVGNGTAASCTFASLRSAVTLGGVVTFDCGSAAVTIAVTTTLNVPTTKNTIIDGANKITLDGSSAVQILRWSSANFQTNDKVLTLQHIALVNGRTTPSQAIAAAPAPCSQGWDDGQGGALYMRDGNLVIVDAIFANNQGALLGPDTGGGAVYVLGSKSGVVIVGSTFIHNTASNGGALGGLFAELNVYNSLFTGNIASGSGANYDDDSKCDAIHNEQNEVGSGGNGGALYSDGMGVNVTLCGDAVVDNNAGSEAYGGGLFYTSNDMTGVLSITDSTMARNSGGHWTNVTGGAVTDVGSAVGVNAKSITVANSILQGRP